MPLELLGVNRLQTVLIVTRTVVLIAILIVIVTLQILVLALIPQLIILKCIPLVLQGYSKVIHPHATIDLLVEAQDLLAQINGGFLLAPHLLATEIAPLQHLALDYLAEIYPHVGVKDLLYAMGPPLQEKFHALVRLKEESALVRLLLIAAREIFLLPEVAQEMSRIPLGIDGLLQKGLLLLTLAEERVLLALLSLSGE